MKLLVAMFEHEKETTLKSVIEDVQAGYLVESYGTGQEQKSIDEEFGIFHQQLDLLEAYVAVFGEPDRILRGGHSSATWKAQIRKELSPEHVNEWYSVMLGTTKAQYRQKKNIQRRQISREAVEMFAEGTCPKYEMLIRALKLKAALAEGMLEIWQDERSCPRPRVVQYLDYVNLLIRAANDFRSCSDLKSDPMLTGLWVLFLFAEFESLEGDFLDYGHIPKKNDMLEIPMKVVEYLSRLPPPAAAVKDPYPENKLKRARGNLAYLRRCPSPIENADFWPNMLELYQFCHEDLQLIVNEDARLMNKMLESLEDAGFAGESEQSQAAKAGPVGVRGVTGVRPDKAIPPEGALEANGDFFGFLLDYLYGIIETFKKFIKGAI